MISKFIHQIHSSTIGGKPIDTPIHSECSTFSECFLIEVFYLTDVLDIRLSHFLVNQIVKVFVWFEEYKMT